MTRRHRTLVLALAFPILAVPPARAETWTVTADQCRRLTPHTPDADVAYRPDPGVVPADVDPPAPQMGEADSLTLDFKMAPATPASGAAATMTRELTAARVAIAIGPDGEARVSLNGRPLDAANRARLLAACAGH